MTITKLQLLAVMPNAKTNADVYVQIFNKYLDSFGINTKLRLAHYLAQIAVESAELSHTVENLNYSAEGLLRTFPRYFTTTTAKAYARNPQKIASHVYANRMGNGNEATGDGFRYRGRGLIQLTGKNNYTAYKNFCGFDVVTNPDLISKPLGATKTSMWYWQKHNLNAYADKDDILGATKAINGGTNGIIERKKYLSRAKKVLGI